MSLANRLSALARRKRPSSHSRQLSRQPRARFVPRFMPLEDRLLLSFTPTLVDAGGATGLDQVLYTTSTSTPKIPTDMPVKLLTIMNNSPNVVYPILLDANSTPDFTQGQVVQINFDPSTQGGSGFSSLHPPQVVFKNGGGSGASAEVSVNGQGQIYSIKLLGGGAGYTSAPDISFDDSANGNKGSGASATANISNLSPGQNGQKSLYDPLDPLNQGYRGYIGEVDPNNPNQVDAGLQPWHQVTVQLPLVFWDGARLFFATNGTGTLQSASDPGNPLSSAEPWQFNSAAPAFMPLPGQPYSATFADPAVGPTSANPAGRVLWYHDSNGNLTGPKGFADDAPGQLTEFTIRDLTQVKYAPNMPQNQLATPVLNYDVSYVDELGLPAMMEATDSYPATNPEIKGAFAGIGADLSVPQMQQLIAAFTKTTPNAANTLLGQYFGGKGYDQYNFPSSISNFDLLPGGFNVFADSALADSESTYNFLPSQTVKNFKLDSGGAVYRVDTGSPNGNGVVTVGSANITGIDPAKIAQLVKGMIVADSGQGPGAQGNYFPAGTYITNVDTVHDTVTVSNPAYFDNSGNKGGTFALTFIGSQWSSASGGSDGSTPQITGLDPNAGQYLSPGMLVTGPGITGYATIKSLITSGGEVTGVTLVDNASPTPNPYIPAMASATSGSPYSFSTGPSSYVAQALIDLWYAWADYYVQNSGATTVTSPGTSTGTNSLTDNNALILSGLNSTANLKVGEVVSGPNIATNYVTGVLNATGGSGYTVGDVLTVSGGTPSGPGTQATLTVTGVLGGRITSVSVLSGGSYVTPPTNPAAVVGGSGTGASFDLTTGNTTVARILSGTSIQLSNAVLTSASGTYTFTAPLPIPRSSDAPAFGANSLSFNGSFTAPYGETPLEFAQTVYDVMVSFSHIPPTVGSKLSLSAQLLSFCIGCNVGSFTGNAQLPSIRGDVQLRDELKSILRGVSDFQEFPEFGTQQDPLSTSQWYPNPATPLTGSLLNGSQSDFNVFNLNPYVYFVHKVLGMNGYGFSVDDDTADVGSLGSNLELAFGSTAATPPATSQSLQNLNYYTTGTPFGPLQGQGSVDTTSGYAKGQPPGVTVIQLPTTLVAKLIAADAQTPGALVSASDGSVPAGTRVVTLQANNPDPTYPPNTGAVVVQPPTGKSISPSTNVTYTFSGFNTLLPAVTSFSPTSGTAGVQQVTITGGNFGYQSNGAFVPAVLSVTFNGIPVAANDVTVNSDTSLTVTVPPGATSGKIAVRSAAGTGYSATDFTVGINNTPNGPLASFVGALYHDVLGRAADAPGLAGWVALLKAGETRLQVASDFEESPESLGREVDQLYARFLHRAADPAGRAFFVAQLIAGANTDELAIEFLTSPEYQLTHASDNDYIVGLYADVLGRAPDAAGLAGWQAAAAAGLSRTALAQAFVYSPEADQDQVRQDYENYLGRAPDPAGLASWVQALESGQSSEQVAEAILASDEYFARAGS